MVHRPALQFARALINEPSRSLAPIESGKLGKSSSKPFVSPGAGLRFPRILVPPGAKTRKKKKKKKSALRNQAGCPRNREVVLRTGRNLLPICSTSPTIAVKFTETRPASRLPRRRPAHGSGVRGDTNTGNRQSTPEQLANPFSRPFPPRRTGRPGRLYEVNGTCFCICAGSWFRTLGGSIGVESEVRHRAASTSRPNPSAPYEPAKILVPLEDKRHNRYLPFLLLRPGGSTVD